jgi:TRAP-type C4-dicarboxylate transport system substrate-binding protein
VDTKVIQEYYKKYKDSVMQDIQVLTVWTAPITHIFSTVPIKSAKDLKDLKIRAGSQSESSIYKDWGMVPVEVAGAERYDALQKGIIDVAGTANMVGTQNHFYEVAPHYVEFPYKTMHAMLIMNKDSFNKLPDDLKEIFENDLIPAYAELSTKTNINDSKTAFEEIKEKVKGKGSVTTLPKEELEKLKEITTSAKEAWLKSAKDRGMDGEKMMKEYKEIQEKILAE